MDKKNDIPLRILIVAGSAARRAFLAHLISRPLNGRAQITADSRISFARFAATRSEILVADLEDSAAASSMLHFLRDAPASAGSVALVDEPDSAWVRSALSASVNAILARDADAGDLQLAVQAAEAGFVLLHPTSVRSLAMDNTFLETAGSTDELSEGLTEDLTAREFEVLRLVGMGLGNKEIAGRLAISEHTVKFHISSVLGKLHASSRTEAVSLGIRRGLIPI
jgi:DNA-binding NarL/FixJ family response regulator